MNSKIDKEVYIKLPPGYTEKGSVLKLERALYGLRRSPLLWQKELTKTLQELGFNPLPYKPCCFIREGVIIFFYVDDIMVAYGRSNEAAAQEAIKQLKAGYDLIGGGLL